MSRGKRFESARRLSEIAIGKRNTRKRETPNIVSGAFVCQPYANANDLFGLISISVVEDASEAAFGSCDVLIDLCLDLVLG